MNGGLFLLFFTLTGITYQTTNIQGIQETKPSAIPTQTITIDSTYTPIPPIPTEMITPKPSNTYVPTGKPTVIPTQYILPTSKPTQIIIPTIQVQQPILNNEGENFSCNCAKTCAQMSSCAEAQYQLNVCGCGARDGDNDGIACDRQCQ